MENSYTLTPRLLHRAGSVERWQIVRTIRTQTLAEHSFMVGMLTLFLCDEIGIEERYRYGMLLYALHHDLSEIITGDVSTVAKDIIKSKGGLDGVLALDSILPISQELKERCGKLGVYVVKIADLIDAISFLHTEGVGKHPQKVKKRINEKLCSLVKEASDLWPHYNWERAFDVLLNAMEGDDIIL